MDVVVLQRRDIAGVVARGVDPSGRFDQNDHAGTLADAVDARSGESFGIEKKSS